MNKKDEKKKAAKYDPTLTAEEKKDARKLTGKEWLYRIGRADDSMWDQSKKKTTYRWAKRIDGHSLPSHVRTSSCSASSRSPCIPPRPGAGS